MSFRYASRFTWICLAAISFVALTLFATEYWQNHIFQRVQDDQVAAMDHIESDLMRNAQQAATRDLVSVQEMAHADVSRVLANQLWNGEIAPLLRAAARIAPQACRSGETEECVIERGRNLRGLPEFIRLDARVRHLIHHTEVVKLKVYDLSGMTVYSSDVDQLGEIQDGNPRFRSAREGRAMSELESRDSFNTFDGVVDKIDVIGSYIPVRVDGHEGVLAVIETYSDVTGSIKQIAATSASYAQMAAANRVEMNEQAQESGSRVLRVGVLQAGLVAALLVSLFLLLVTTVRRAQRTAERQTLERDAAKRQLAHAEKMTALGQMVAGVAHQLNTPLAFSRSNVEMIRGALTRIRPLPPGLASAPEMLDDIVTGMDQMNELVGKLRDFTRLDREQTASVDIREALTSVSYIARAVVSTKIRIVEAYEELPPIACNVSQLNQAFLNILMNAAQAMKGDGTIMIHAGPMNSGIGISIRDTGPGIPHDVLPHIFEPQFTTKPAGEGTGLGLTIAQEAVAEHGGTIKVDTSVGIGTTFFIHLPLHVERATEAFA
jgi:two-component system NtrC family sensor kinase